MKKSDTEKTLHALNILIGFFLFMGGIWFVCTITLSITLFFIGFIVNFALSLIYEKYILYGRFRKSVIVLRSIAITVLALAVLAPIMVIKFDKTKILYPVKRFCYSYGVYGGNRNNVLPLSLPKKCSDYLFITQGSFPAQDYHPSAYLAFHTDSETLKQYEEHFSSLNDAELKITHMPDKEKYVAYDDSWLKCPEELPQHVFQRLEPEHIHDFEKAIIYIVPAYYNKGCMLDYDSGLAVFWY
ncbi:MAG: hypothetical protein K2F73_07840 [Ruminococcus sp.]|nr:hypothetical protein [Ruminococcus sp.]